MEHSLWTVGWGLPRHFEINMTIANDIVCLPKLEGKMWLLKTAHKLHTMLNWLKNRKKPQSWVDREGEKAPGSAMRGQYSQGALYEILHSYKRTNKSKQNKSTKYKLHYES